MTTPEIPPGFTGREECKKATLQNGFRRILQEKEIRQFGEYRTRRLVLEAWDRMEAK